MRFAETPATRPGFLFPADVFQVTSALVGERGAGHFATGFFCTPLALRLINLYLCQRGHGYGGRRDALREAVPARPPLRGPGAVLPTRLENGRRRRGVAQRGP